MAPAVFEEIRTELITSLYLFDFSSAFPSSYAGTKAVLLTEGWPYDLLDNMLNENDGQMTEPIIAVLLAVGDNVHRSLGNVAAGAAAGHIRYATRIEATYLVSCFADQKLGGMDTVERLLGLLQGWTFLNQATLASFRQLRGRRSGELYQDRPQIWRGDMEVEGYALLSYDI